MFRILKHFLFTAVFAVFGSQASAMFIQADWFDPSDPAVGTNRYAYSHNDPINLADPGGNVPYNPGGNTSTGWTQHENGSETYDSRTDRYSSDYLNSDSDNHHTIGEYNPDFFSENVYGSRTRTRSHVNSRLYSRDSGYRGAQQAGFASFAPRIAVYFAVLAPTVGVRHELLLEKTRCSILQYS